MAGVERPYDYAIMANNAYDSNYDAIALPSGYQRLTTLGGDTSGYDGVVYINPETKQIVIAHRGTEFETELGADLLKQDLLHIWLGAGLGEQFKEALEATQFVMKNYPQYQITHTGHSLGGWLSETMAMVFDGQKSISFDSPGSDQACASVDGFMANTFKSYLAGASNVAHKAVVGTLKASEKVAGAMSPSWLDITKLNASKLPEKTRKAYLALYQSLIKKTDTCSPARLNNMVRYVSTPNIVNTANSSLIQTIPIFGNQIPDATAFSHDSHYMDFILTGFDSVSGKLKSEVVRLNFRSFIPQHPNPALEKIASIHALISTYRPRN